MLLLERLAEQKIREAEARGEFEDLPGTGEPLNIEQDNPYVPAELRTAYRLLKNAGYLPDALCLRRDLHEAEQLLLLAETEDEIRAARARLRLLLERLGAQRSSTMTTQQDYFDRLSERLSVRE